MRTCQLPEKTRRDATDMRRGKKRHGVDGRPTNGRTTDRRASRANERRRRTTDDGSEQTCVLVQLTQAPRRAADGSTNGIEEWMDGLMLMECTEEAACEGVMVFHALRVIYARLSLDAGFLFVST